MVGQFKNKQLIDKFISNESFPRFIILAGSEGSGKRTFAKYISEKLKSDFLLYDNKIESVREIINTAYTQTKNILYCIYGYETMSIASKNALLKIAEEPPTNTYVILTATNKNDILSTLTSRAVVIDMEEYTINDIRECAELFGVNNIDFELCEVPLDILKLNNINQEEFKTFVDNVWEKIGSASIGNSLKITSKLKLKEEQDGYDVNLFLKALMRKLLDDYFDKSIPRNFKSNILKEDIKAGIDILKLCYETKNKLNSKYNKQALLDNFIINLRNLRNGTI